jgi:RNA polymerase sigma factor (sigma-70 family)
MIVNTASLRSADDDELLAQARAGNSEAFGVLFERHRLVAVRLARSITDRVDPEDVVEEAFVRIFAALRGSGGPTSNFRAYLLTAVRRQAIDQGRASANLIPSEDKISELESRESDESPALDGVTEELRSALSRLPERWRLALWKTEVEGIKPRELGLELELSANAAAALVYRAREGLREAYLLGNVSGRVLPDCEPFIELLPGHVRGYLRGARARKVDEHLSTCAHCTLRISEITALSNRFNSLDLGTALAILAPVALGGGAAHALGVLPAVHLTSSSRLPTARRVGGWLAHGKAWLGAAAALLLIGTGAFLVLRPSSSVRSVPTPPVSNVVVSAVVTTPATPPAVPPPPSLETPTLETPTPSVTTAIAPPVTPTTVSPRPPVTTPAPSMSTCSIVISGGDNGPTCVGSN